jgi:hypothetical protein
VTTEHLQAFAPSDIPAKMMALYINEHIDMVASTSAKSSTRTATHSRRPSSQGRTSAEPTLELSSRNDLTSFIIGQIPAPEEEEFAVVHAVPRWLFHLQGSCEHENVARAMIRIQLTSWAKQLQPQLAREVLGDHNMLLPNA